MQDYVPLKSKVIKPNVSNPNAEDALMHAESVNNEVMLTTSDNPFDPFTEFDSWLAFDSSQNYNSCSYLARIAKTSDDLSDADNSLAIESAIDEIVQLNILGIYKKVSRQLILS